MSSQVPEDINQAAGGRVHFQWRNCFGDVIATKFDLVIKDYWSKVAMPALSSAEAEVEHWANRDDGGAVFAHADRLDQRAVTAAAMCLSIQSIWERQLRRYLVTCAGYLAADAALRTRIQRAHWGDLKALFTQMRGVPLKAFLSFSQLDLLAALGNVCRHGDGSSANTLWSSHPELWPAYCREPVVFPGDAPAERTAAPSFSEMSIETAMLDGFVVAIAGFWEMVGYLYHESLVGKPPVLEAQLIIDRQRLAQAIQHFNNTVGLST